MKKLLLVVLLIAGLGYMLLSFQSFHVEEAQKGAQSILDREIKENALAVDAVNAPRLAFIPFVGPLEWRSYIFLTGKNGLALDPQKCPFTTDYEVKLSGTNTLAAVKWVISVYTMRLQECSDALKANG